MTPKGSAGKGNWSSSEALRPGFFPTWLYLSGPGEWTKWFNIDHPGGQGDYERLDAIHFYYGDRVCARPLRLEARTTDWIPAGSTGQVVHGSPREGFWCLNREQRPGQNCSNYTVRFLCPPGEPECPLPPTSHQPCPRVLAMRTLDITIHMLTNNSLES